MEVVRAGTAGGDDVAADVGVRGTQPLHRPVDLELLAGSIVHHHEMTLVAHHAAHVETLRPGEVGEASCVGRIAAASGEPDVDVDEAAPHAGPRRSLDRGLAVDGDGHVDAVTELGQRPEAMVVEDLVGDEEVGTEPRLGHPDGLARRRGREGVVAVGPLAGTECRALVRLDVRAQCSAGVGGRHRRQVGLRARRPR